MIRFLVNPIVLMLAACLTAYVTFWLESRGWFSERAAGWLIGVWVIWIAMSVTTWAFLVDGSCDWNAILEMFGWCTPCAYYYWYANCS